MSTYNIPLSIQKKSPELIPNTILSAASEFFVFVFVRKSRNEFEIAMVNEPSLFQPLKVYCIWFNMLPYFVVIFV